MGFFGPAKNKPATTQGGNHYVAPVVPNSKVAGASMTSTPTTRTTSTAATFQKKTPNRDPPVAAVSHVKSPNNKGGVDLFNIGGGGGAATAPSNAPNTPQNGDTTTPAANAVAVAKKRSFSLLRNKKEDDAPVITLQPVNEPSYNKVHDEETIGDGTMQTYDKSFLTARSKDSVDSKDTAFTITRNGQYLTLNGFANGHLIRWKFAAEEGSAIIRIPALMLAVGTIFTTLWPIVTVPAFWTIPVLICAFHSVSLCLLIIILEGRAVAIRSPTNARARLRNLITRYLSVLKFVWGRGLLYIYAASMNLTLDHAWVIYTSLPLIAFGIFAIIAGGHASYNLDQLKSSLTDESYLWVKFSQNDQDMDGLLDTNGFAELLWCLGLEFDDMYTYKAFKQIDTDNDGYISFDDFKHWWIVTQNDGKGNGV
jgi:EF-hand domain pair